MCSIQYIYSNGSIHELDPLSETSRRASIEAPRRSESSKFCNLKPQLDSNRLLVHYIYPHTMTNCSLYFLY